MLDADFIRNLGLMVLAAALCSLAARAFRLPTIVAYLLAGLALGPWTGLVELSDSIALISEFGIVLLLFLVGLELSLDKIRGMGRAVLVAGLAQVGLTLAGAFALGRLLGFPPLASLILGIALTFSSTVVVVKLLEELHEFNSLHGRLAVGILLLQDLVVIVLLTIMSGLQSQTEVDVATISVNVLKAFAGMSLLVLLALLASKRLLPRPFAWAARSPETLFIWSLSWCFVMVFLAHKLHVSPEAGAFLAGVSLAQLPYNHDLRRRVHPLMNFFIAVFFVSLGIQMNLDGLTTDWPVLLAMTAFVLIGKSALIAWTLARLRFGERTAFAGGLTLGQISEFSFILSAAAYQSGWIDARLVSLIGLVGLVSISLSSILIPAHHTLARALHSMGWLRLLRAGPEADDAPRARERHGHVLLVGMNTLGRLLAQRLHDRGETVLAIDTDPAKLSGLPCPTLMGNVEYPSLLDEAGLAEAKLLVSALQIEPTNDLLAYRCRLAKIPCAIHVVDLSVVDNLLALDVNYLILPKVDGIKLQTKAMAQMGILPS